MKNYLEHKQTNDLKLQIHFRKFTH